MAISLDEASEDVAITIGYLEKKGLLEIIEDDEYFLNRVPELLGSESYSAERVRRHRERKKNQDLLQSDEQALQSNSHVTKSRYREDIDIEKSRSREEGIKKIYHYYESNGFGTLAQKTMQDFEYWISDFEKIGATENDAVELIIHALGIAVDRNKRNYGYANAIMKSWEQNKFLKVSDVEANDKMRQQSMQPINQEPKMPDYSVPDELKVKLDDLPEPDFEMPY